MGLLRATSCPAIPERLPAQVIERLAPHLPPVVDFARVRLREGIPWWAPAGPSAIVWRDTIYFAPGCYEPDTAHGLALIGHELVHVAQFRRLGTVRFAWSYLAAYVRGRLRGLGPHAAYCEIAHEREARAIAAAVRRASDEVARA